MTHHITCMLADSGLLWIGTNSGFILTIPLPRLEGVPQLRGQPSVSFHAQSGPVQFISAIQCNMVPLGMSAGKSADSTLSQVKEETATNIVAQTDNELLGPLQKQPSWVSSPDLSVMNDSETDEYGGSVADLYGSLLKGIDMDLESELTNSNVVVRRHNQRIQPSTINAVSNRVINRLSNVISKGRADVQARLKPQPIPKEFRQTPTSATDADQNVSSPVSNVYEEPRPSLLHESLSSPSLAESESSNTASEVTAVFERASSVNASHRRLVVPVCPSMVSSNLVHVQSNKALIIVSGGTGYKCWSKNKLADLPSVDDSCLLLWKC